MAVEERDCTEGCADDGHPHKWQIEPHPRSGDFDTYVTDDDQEARRVFMEAAEAAWDDCEPGQTRTITIRHYSSVETKVSCEKCGVTGRAAGKGSAAIGCDREDCA
jgi:hypothetical protein